MIYPMGGNIIVYEKLEAVGNGHAVEFLLWRDGNDRPS